VREPSQPPELAECLLLHKADIAVAMTNVRYLGTTNIARLGNIVEKIGTSQRILPQAVQQRFEVSSSGALVPPTEGSTKPVKS
jgi:hypothetical protein